MADVDTPAEVYQLHIWLHEISPMIWRRLLVRSDSTIADLHYTVQIVFGWTDSHLHRFAIHGKSYGIAQLGGITFADDPQQVYLNNIRFRVNERFRYEYDFSDFWQHEIRVEQLLALDSTKTYPVCIGGARDHFKVGATACSSAPSSILLWIGPSARCEFLLRPGKKRSTPVICTVSPRFEMVSIFACGYC